MNRPVDRTLPGLHPLSPPQQWALVEGLAAGSAGAALVCVLAGAPAVAALAAAWRRLAARHPILGSAIAAGGAGAPGQRFARPLDLALEAMDLAAVTAGAEEKVAAVARRPFAHHRPPLARLALARLGPGSWRLALGFHRAVLDAAAARRALAELLDLYEALRRGEAPSPPPAPSYARYLEWLAGRDGAAAEAFWRRRLEAFSAATPLGIAPPAVAADAVPGCRSEPLPSPPPGRLDLLGVTAEGLVAGGWALLLGRYGGRREVCFGVRAEARPAELDGSALPLGPFTVLLPLRADVRLDVAAADFFAALSAELAAVRRHPHVTPGEIRRWSGVPAGSPLFESLLELQAAEEAPQPGSKAGTAGAAGPVAGEPRLEASAGHPLELTVATGERFSLTLRFDRRRCDEATAGRLLGHLRTLLTAVLADPGRPLSTLPYLTAGERHQLLAEWNDSARALPPETTLAAVVRRRAAAHPEAVAVSCGEERWSYARLEGVAGSLAAELLARGAGGEGLVALLAPRGPELLAALLAVWKAGGACLPLDPRLPDGRLAGLLGDAGAPLVLVAPAQRRRLRRLLGELPAGPRPAVLTLERPAEDPSPLPPARLPPGEPEALAYVLFTSGSTGRPKGAMITQGGMLNHLWAKVVDLALDRRDVIAQTAPLSFDVSIWQLTAAAVVGARVEVFDDEIACNPPRLLGRARERGVTVLEVVPAVLGAALAVPAAGAGGAGALSRLLVTGEALPPDLARRALAALPGVALVNAYGPTECSDDVSHHSFDRPPPPAARVPIGRPVINLRLVVVDRRGDPLPVGVAGELWVGGRGVGRGYLGAAARTAESFVPAPFATVAGERFYRTGDRVRRLPDGGLDYLGRLDRQVKLRGQRLEPGEVEAALLRHPQVAAAVVVTAPDGGGGQRLVGCLVPAAGPAPDGGELRVFLTRQLPAYMVPAQLVLLPRLPLTANGKVDREALFRQLPAPAAGGEAAPPGDEVEAALAAVWRRVLGRGGFGVDDNFFDLGGNSLDLALVHSELAGSVAAGVSLLELFRYPTVRSLSARLRSSAPAPSAPRPARAAARLATGARRRRARDARRGARGTPPRPAPAAAAEAPPAPNPLGERNAS